MAHVLLGVLAKLAVPMFFFGMLGSALVVITTVARDLGEVISSDDDNVTEL